MKLLCSEVSGYIMGNPNNIILDCEEELLMYLAGDDWEDYKCVLTDSGTNAFKSCLYYNEVVRELNLEYNLPVNTYISMYMALQQYPDLNVNLTCNLWENYYKVGNIIDSAAYLPKGNLKDLFVDGVEFVILSFGNQKPLANNRGGAIIFKSYESREKYNFLKRYIHNGRDSAKRVEYDTLLFDLENRLFIGERYNIVPEQAKTLLGKIKDKSINKDVKVRWYNYPDIKNILENYN